MIAQIGLRGPQIIVVAGNLEAESFVEAADRRTSKSSNRNSLSNFTANGAHLYAEHSPERFKLFWKYQMRRVTGCTVLMADSAGEMRAYLTGTTPFSRQFHCTTSQGDGTIGSNLRDAEIVPSSLKFLQ